MNQKSNNLRVLPTARPDLLSVNSSAIAPRPGSLAGVPLLGILESLLTSGARHREEMARIRLEESRIEHEYRLLDRRLDLAFQTAMQERANQHHQVELHYASLMQSLSIHREESAQLQQALLMASQIAFAGHESETIRLAAINLVMRLTEQLGQQQTERHRHLEAKEAGLTQRLAGHPLKLTSGE